MERQEVMIRNEMFEMTEGSVVGNGKGGCGHCMSGIYGRRVDQYQKLTLNSLL